MLGFPPIWGKSPMDYLPYGFYHVKFYPPPFIKGDVFPFGKVRERKQRVRKGEKRELWRESRMPLFSPF